MHYTPEIFGNVLIGYDWYDLLKLWALFAAQGLTTTHMNTFLHYCFCGLGSVQAIAPLVLTNLCAPFACLFY